MPAHCGHRGEGFFLHTLCAVDIATGWVECEPIWGKGHVRVNAGLHEIRGRLPVPLRGLDSDNGSEFINRPLYYYCHREGIVFTRSRAYRKNDSAHVEQKNGAIVRHLIGYDRYTSKAAHAQLARVYRLVRLHTNFFQPVQRLVAKSRHGARVRRRHDRAQTPYQRVCAAGVLASARQAELEAARRARAPHEHRGGRRARARRPRSRAPEPRAPRSRSSGWDEARSARRAPVARGRSRAAPRRGDGGAASAAGAAAGSGSGSRAARRA